MNRLLRLYPRAWQARYGDELAALLAEQPPRLGDRLDLLRGVLDAHLHPELVPGARMEGRSRFADVPPADLRVARRLGFGALVGAAAWFLGWLIAANGPVVTESWGSYRDGGAAMPVFLLAGALLAAGILGQFIVLPARAPLARAAGIVAIVGVLLWCLAPWQLPVGLAGLIGLEVLALSAWRGGSWPGLAVLIMSLGAVGGPLLLTTAMFGGPIGILEMPPAYLAAIVALVIPWIAIGGTLLGTVPARVEAERS